MKLLKIIILLIVTNQCDAQIDSVWKTIRPGDQYSFANTENITFAKAVPVASVFEYHPPQNLWVSLDTCNLSYFRSNKEMRENKNAAWQVHVSADTVRFIVPPKHMIVGNNSYTSMFLNGNWYFLMDPTNLK